MASASSKKVIYTALFANAAIAVTKFVAASFTGSSAMLSEGVHSIVDTGNQGLLLYGGRRAAKPPDTAHPFGVSVRSGRGMGPVKRISHVEARPHKVLSFCW